MLSHSEAAALTPRELRRQIGRGNWSGPTTGLARGHAQANLVVLPADLAFHFLLFCQRNPAPCPVLEVIEPGDSRPTEVASADLRCDLPRYRIFRRGKLVDEPTSVHHYWRDDLTAFLLGCSLTFEDALLAAGIPLRHRESGRALPGYETNLPCRPAGPFRSNMVVSLRPMPGPMVPRAVQITGQFPLAHGAPVHVGDPASIGIDDLQDVYFGDPPAMQPDDVPVFSACGVTPQLAAVHSQPEFMITHYPEHMLVCDIASDELKIP